MNNNSTLAIWNSAFRSVDPVEVLKGQFLPGFRKISGAPPTRAFLLWGKVSARFLKALKKRGALRPEDLILVISPDPGPRNIRWVRGEHPLPGRGSFRAGRAIEAFFRRLSEENVSELYVYLSGGASSLAWLPPPSLSADVLEAKLRALYRGGLDIRTLNRERSKLCRLKAGGAARLLEKISPNTRARVFVLSDVAPYGPGIVGSGPFWNGSVRHHVIADNRTLVNALAKEARRRRIPVIDSKAALKGTVDEWASKIARDVKRSVKQRKQGFLIYGGEPTLKLPPRLSGRSRGGRQTQLALRLSLKLILELGKSVTASQIELLAMSSDGQDGTSRFAGVQLPLGNAASAANPRERAKISDALNRFDAARWFIRRGLFIKSPHDGAHSNVQDVILIRLHH